MWRAVTIKIHGLRIGVMTRVKLGATRGATAPVRVCFCRAIVPIPAPKPRFRRERFIVRPEADRGNDVTLTLNSNIQEAAEKQLAGYKGAVVVMDSKTGAILAMASSPNYDANDVEDFLDTSADDDTS